MRLRAEGWNGSGPPLRLLQSSSSHGLPSVSSPGLSFGLLTSLMCRVVAVVVILTMVFVHTEQLIGFNGGSLTRTLQTLEAYSCEGGTLAVSCPASTVISVQYAKYGRSVPSSLMCPRGAAAPDPRSLLAGGEGEGWGPEADGGQGAKENTNCLAVRSLEVLLDLCEDRAECQVLAESTTFRQDPCPSTYKYLEVHYKCRPNEFQRLTVCEDEQMEVWCKRSTRIAIYSAMFGRVPNGSAPCPPNRPGYIDCQSAETVSEVRTACQGRKRCDLQASEAVFGKPCAAGINKYLTVTYACVPKNILKELHRHRGRLGANRTKKKKKKKKKKRKNNKGEVVGGQRGKVTRLTTTGQQDSDTTSPSGALSESQSTQVLETYLQTSIKASADKTSKDQNPTSPPSVTFHPHLKPSTPTSPTPVSAADTNSKDAWPDSTWWTSGRDSSVPTTDQFGPSRDQGRFGTDQDSDISRPDWDGDQVGLHRDQDHLDTSESRDHFDSDINRDQTGPNQNRDYASSDLDHDSSSPTRDWPEDWRDQVRPNLDQTNSRDNSVSATRPGESSAGQGRGGGESMSTEPTDSGESVGSVTEANLTVLCVNHTVGVPTVRTLPSNSEMPIGVVRELFSAVRFVQGHQERAILYLVLGMCAGVIFLLMAVLGRVCYKLKRRTHAKLDMTEPTHSRNVSHLAHHMNHHSLLDTPMLEHSDSIDRIEVVRFEPRGTLRSGYHSTLHSDSGDRSLNNYYG